MILEIFNKWFIEISFGKIQCGGYTYTTRRQSSRGIKFSSYRKGRPIKKRKYEVKEK